uniref:NADH-ubiquinone oxidoreductase chain 2 n=1 Tax=Tenomerga trabecula TaxID=2843307 RepID=A0A8F0F5G8_9COLE|nr:NADH dehydrogenase subunit 2 [Tenomerga trabecula]
MKTHKFLFNLTLILGTMISISSYSWLSVWMGLEINLISFIPMILDTTMTSSTESSIKYFISQSMASTMLLMSIITMTMNFYPTFISQSMASTMMLTTSMMMKLGMPPIHLWFIQVIEGISWKNMFILMTWQKFAPMVILTYSMSYQSKIILIIIMYSAIISSISGLNQTKLPKILAFSSINHISWMISSMLVNELIWLIYFLIYSINSLSITIMFKQSNSFFIYQLMNFLAKEPENKFILSFNLFSLGGLPPLLGFFPKWLTIQFLMPLNLQFLTFTLTMSTLITLFFYLRICFLLMLTQSSSMNWKVKKIKSLSLNRLLMAWINFLQPQQCYW